jgi:hypothetical protein
MNVYPNPSSGYFYVDIEVPDQMTTEDKQLSVVDMFGKNIISRWINTTEKYFQESFDLTGKTNGLYFIVLQLANKTITRKLVLNQ